MRLLLDEQLDQRLRNEFNAGLDVWTVADRGWTGMKNGALLRSAQKEFDAFITMDKGIEHQQNWKELTMGIIIVSAKTNRYADVVPLMPKIHAALQDIQQGILIHVGL